MIANHWGLGELDVDFKQLAHSGRSWLQASLEIPNEKAIRSHIQTTLCGGDDIAGEVSRAMTKVQVETNTETVTDKEVKAEEKEKENEKENEGEKKTATVKDSIGVENQGEQEEEKEAGQAAASPLPLSPSSSSSASEALTVSAEAPKQQLQEVKEVRKGIREESHTVSAEQSKLYTERLVALYWLVATCEYGLDLAALYARLAYKLPV